MLPLLSLIPAVGQILGGISGGGAEGRLKEAELGQGADRLALDRARLGQDQNDSSIGLDLDQRRYADQSNDRSSRNALLASLLGGMQDYQMQLPPGLEPYKVQSTGGFRPSSMGNREDISRLIMEQALSELENPLEAGGIGQEAAPVAAVPQRPLNKVEMRTGRQQPAAAESSDIGASQVVSEQSGRRLPQINLANIPGASATPQSGLLDKILSGLSIGGSLVGAATGGAKPAGQSGGISVPGNPADILRRAGVRF